MKHWDLVTDLLSRATELPAAERRNWLKASGHPAKAIDQAASLLDTWEADPHYLEIDLPIPDLLGPWRIGKEIGHGGMGRVYEAIHSDPSLARRVALKVIGAGRFAPSLIDSFLQERAILARLAHPGIARLYDTGTTPQGMPYFAMEFIDGTPIDQWVEAAQPSLFVRIELLLKVCSAIAYAHRNLIVHGDIKPGNILVTASGEPCLLDFGIGRILTTPDAGTLPMLTPNHASPEQLAGLPITTASDIFQLGLLLRLLIPTPNRELIAVIEKCLQQDPVDRYQSAVTLQQDLGAWLNHKPISVIRPTWPYIVQKLIRRHPLGAALVVALLLGTLTTAWQARRANLNRQIALHQFEKTRSFARSMLQGISKLPIAVRKPIVQNTIQLLNSVDLSQEQDPVLILELAYAWQTLGRVQGLPTSPNFGETDAAAESYDKAIALARRARASSERDSVRLLSALFAEASRVHLLRKDQSRVDVLIQNLQSSIQALAVFGPSSSLANAYSELAFFQSAKDRRRAMETYRIAIAQFDRAPDPDWAQQAFAFKRLGALHLAERSFPEGEANYQKALALERKTNAEPFQISFTLSDLGHAASQQRLFPKALTYYQEALSIREAALQADPDDVRVIGRLGSVHDNMASIYADSGNLDEAIQSSRRAVSFSQRAARPPADSTYSRTNLTRHQLSLAVYLRAKNPVLHAVEVRGLISAVRLSLQRDPDAALSAKLKAFGS